MADEAKAVDALLQVPGDVLDRVLALLSKVGVELPPLGLQLFLLVLVAALLVPAIRTLKARRKADRTPWIAVAALSLVEAGILVGIVENATTPGRVHGTLQSEQLAQVTLQLLDFRDLVISTDAGRADTTTGEFALHYNPIWDGRARKLRVTAPGCAPQQVDLARSQLRAEAELRWTYPCAPV